jgi:hypothetical protein
MLREPPALGGGWLLAAAEVRDEVLDPAGGDWDYAAAAVSAVPVGPARMGVVAHITGWVGAVLDDRDDDHLLIAESGLEALGFGDETARVRPDLRKRQPPSCHARTTACQGT